MNAAEEQALWQRLSAAKLATGEPPPRAAATTPWFVRVMQGVGGWISALFLLFFVGAGLEFVFKSTTVAFVFGLCACAIAGVIFRSKSANDYLAQFGLAISLAGQGLVLFAIGDGFRNETSTIALGMCLFQAILFFAMPNFVHRVWTAWTGAGAAVFALADWQLQAYAPGLLSLACAWVWLNEFRYVQRSAMLRAAGYGLILALMCAVAWVTATNYAGYVLFFDYRLPAHAYHFWIGTGLSGITLLWAVQQLLLREGVQPVSGAGLRLLAAASILALATLKAPGLAPATLILLLGYGNGSRILFGLGVASLLGYLSFYYYSLSMTLLQKSEIMAATGTALLAVRFLLLQGWSKPSPQEDRHA